VERADIVQARAEWRRVQDETPCGHLVFLDESGAKTNMTRLYGRAPVGERCFDHAPDGRWKTVTMLPTIRLMAPRNVWCLLAHWTGAPLQHT